MVTKMKDIYIFVSPPPRFWLKVKPSFVDEMD